MQKNFIVVGALFLSIATTGVHGQSVVGGIQGKGLDMQTAPNGYVTGLPLAPLAREGNYYLFDEWSTGTIYLESVKIENHYFKYDIKLNQMEIKLGNEVKVLDGRRVKQFDLVTAEGSKTFINAAEFKLNGTPLIGFFNVIADGTWKVLSKTDTKIQKSTYVSSLDAGDRKEKIVKDVRYFIAQDSNLIDPKKIKKKTVHDIFKNQPENVRQQIIDSNFNTKSIVGLTSLVSLLNSSASAAN
ncbi:hypothetical protein [Pseudochryseolinea flava]|uniref:Uncharacterized protein n=1 Tax=Pseudochryseolinea flava TaxID=2059302 RepID=A0A364Y0W9_9BACT|nr:hypothetical protein [Pseudochryseolinea flava]RAV99912.1 hypothetical protein DQQ10_17900 [Pseudochryseolinea flava]